MGLTEGFVPYQMLKKAWSNDNSLKTEKSLFGHVSQASSKIFWQILKQLLKLLTPTFIFLLLNLTGKGDAVLKQEIFKKTSLMCLLKWNLINLPELTVLSKYHQSAAVPLCWCSTTLRGSAASAAALLFMIPQRGGTCMSHLAHQLHWAASFTVC